MGCNDVIPTLDYIIKTDKVVLNSNGNINVVWFKDVKKFTISGTSLYFKTKYGNVMVSEDDITAYNGWGIPPSITDIYNATSEAIKNYVESLEVTVGNTVTVSGLSSPYRVISDRDPLVTDDISFGHTVTTQWLNTVSKDLFECLDNTLGAAVWHKIQYIYL
jgi:hypothetical protein